MTTHLNLIKKFRTTVLSFCLLLFVSINTQAQTNSETTSNGTSIGGSLGNLEDQINPDETPNNAPNGGSFFKELYSRTRCIECKFSGCIELRQPVVLDQRDGKVRNGPLKINVYDFPCACNTAKREDWKDEKGRTPAPWHNESGVLAYPQAPVRHWTRVNPDDNTFSEILSVGGASTDDFIFSLPPDIFIHLIDPSWPHAYPKLVGDYVKELPSVPCGAAKPNKFSSSEEQEKIIKLIDKIKKMVAEGKSSDPLDNWLKEMQKQNPNLKLGRAVTVVNPNDALIDFNRFIQGHNYIGDCWTIYPGWNEVTGEFVLEALVNPEPIDDGQVPIDYNDENIWRHSYPVTNVTIINLLNGEILFNQNYNKQKDITITSPNITSGTLFNVRIQSFDGRTFDKKFAKQ